MFIQFLKKAKSINRILVTFLFVILVLTSCTTDKGIKKQEKNPSFEYLNVFGGALFDIVKGVFPLKDGTFYIVVETYSPASTGDIPKSCHFKNNNLILCQLFLDFTPPLMKRRQGGVGIHQLP